MDDSFQKLLDVYTEQFLLYITSGIGQYKAAYEAARDKIESTLSAKRQKLEAGRNQVKQFAGSVSDTAPTDVPDTADVIDQYEAAKIRYDSLQSPKTPDYSLGYAIMLRVGILLVSFAALFVVVWYGVI